MTLPKLPFRSLPVVVSQHLGSESSFLCIAGSGTGESLGDGEPRSAGHRRISVVEGFVLRFAVFPENRLDRFGFLDWVWGLGFRVLVLGFRSV